jgi:hypothetical protein
MLGRGRLFKKPGNDSSSDEDNETRTIINKPIAESIARKMDTSIYNPRTFVQASTRSQQEFYGHQDIMKDGLGVFYYFVISIC